MGLQPIPSSRQPSAACIPKCLQRGLSAATSNGTLEQPLITPPKNLHRILYIPRHTSDTTHLPLYDISDRYRSAVQGTIFGSSFYYLKLWGMERPRGDGLDFPVDYLVNMNADADREKEAHIHVEKRTLLRQDDAWVDVSIPFPLGEKCLISDSSGHERVVNQPGITTMTVSYPIKPSKQGNYRIPHPYFAFQLKDRPKGSGKLVEWQVHPAPKSSICYVLVELDATSSGSGSQSRSAHKPLDDRILAIYQHSGLAVWLPPDFSEGLLLLPERRCSGDQADEAVVIASLLALLYQMRGVKHMQPQRMQTLAGSKKLVKEMLSNVKKTDAKAKEKVY